MTTVSTQYRLGNGYPVHPDTRFFDRVGIRPRLGIGYPGPLGSNPKGGDITKDIGVISPTYK
jgi:hypothetical protein